MGLYCHFLCNLVDYFLGSGFMTRTNALVAQSGGPSPVINASLQGVIEACCDYTDHIDNIYAAWHGVEGILQEELIDMRLQPAHEIKLLRQTPASGAIGTCRYKLTAGQSEDFDRILEIITAHDIGYFFYIGGNDSMDTASKISKLAAQRGIELAVAGIPKTIDNDIGDPDFKLIDHTPGYGSTARYWASVIKDIDEENRAISISECVCVLQAMGRKSGFIPAAARLADPNREMPLQIYMAEAHHNLESLAENVNRQLKQTARCIVVVSEGFDVGSLGEARDGFGHIEYGASKNAAAQVVANYLNETTLAARGQASWQVPGVLQRSMSAYASSVDIDEAYQVARKAVDIAVTDAGGYMATILRKFGTDYCAYYDRVPLEAVASSVRLMPADWITKDGLDVTDDFIRYAEPLIGQPYEFEVLENGLPRFARISADLIEKKLGSYIPVRLR